MKKIEKNIIIKNDELLSNVYMESSPFVWKGKLKYFVAERDERNPNLQIHNLAIYDFNTRKKESSFGEGLGLASASLIDNTLYITATKNWFEFGKSEIYLITSKDLKTFSQPKLIYHADENQKIFNTSITKNNQTGEFIISYESHDDKSVPFTIYFLKSKDGQKWIPVTNATFGKDIYVACPTIKYIGDTYYLLFGMEEHYDPNCPTCVSYVTKIARSKNLKKWETSPHQFMVADRKDEGVNNSDVDFTEYNGKTYLFYAIGDQATWGSLKYATYDDAVQNLLKNYFYN